MPTLDEGSFLYMPITMPHASIGEAMDQLSKVDMAVNAIPEVAQAVGKIGRVESALDPAPISMIEMVVNYKSEYKTDEAGRRLTFKFDDKNGRFVRTTRGELIPDKEGRPYRQWRDEIRTPDDIWDEIVKAAEMPGTTSAPKLQPIAARIVMLQSGMRAPMGVKIKGPDLETIEKVGYKVERDPEAGRRGCSLRPSLPTGSSASHTSRSTSTAGSHRPLRHKDPGRAGCDRGRHRRQAGHHDRRGT